MSCFFLSYSINERKKEENKNVLHITNTIKWIGDRQKEQAHFVELSLEIRA